MLVSTANRLQSSKEAMVNVSQAIDSNFENNNIKPITLRIFNNNNNNNKRKR